MTSLIKKRNKYYKYIWEYVKRRDKLRLKYYNSVQKPRQSNVPYSTTVTLYNNKLRHWRRQLVKLDKIRDNIVFLETTIKQFFGKSIKYVNVPDHILSIPHCIYFKFGIEQGLSGTHLSEHIRFEKIWNASRYRKEFTNSLQTNPENKELWLRFKKFYERRLEAEANRFISTKKTA